MTVRIKQDRSRKSGHAHSQNIQDLPARKIDYRKHWQGNTDVALSLILWRAEEEFARRFGTAQPLVIAVAALKNLEEFLKRQSPMTIDEKGVKK